MAFQEQVEKLVQKLTGLTQEGKVLWEQTVDERTFLASVASVVISVRELPPYDAPDYQFTIRNAEGRVLDEAIARGGDEWTRLRGLYEMARRQALHVDEALSDILASLERI